MARRTSSRVVVPLLLATSVYAAAVLRVPATATAQQRGAARACSPVARAKPVLWPLDVQHEADEHFVHVHGIPWELDNVAEALAPFLPPVYTIVETVLPLDKRARTTGRALLRLKAVAGHDLPNATDVVDALQHQYVGTRWLDARLSQASEFAYQKRAVDAIQERVSGRARQAYCRPTQADTARVPEDPRDVVLVCHGTSQRIGLGHIDLNNLPNGRLDVLARCIAATLFVSHGVRGSSRLWMLLRDVGLTICVDGARIKGLHPDERTLASAIRQALLSHHSGGSLQDGQSAPVSMPVGWNVYGRMASPEEESFEDRLAAIVRGGAEGSSGGSENAAAPDGAARPTPAGSDEPVRFFVLHERGEPFTQLVSGAGNCHEDGDASSTRTVLVVGDHIGFTEEEEDALRALDATRASLGPVPLLASHCIVLAHAALDAKACSRQTSS